MKEKEYLNQPMVIDFVNWIKDKLTDNFEHEYDDVKNKEHWSCTSIYNAYEKYSWPISPKWHNQLNIDNRGFESNKKVLSHLTNEIKKAYANHDNTELYNASKEILAWGGVLGSKERGNLKYLEENKDNLFEIYEKVENSIVISPELKKEYKDIKMNAGYTKIYSLLFDNFIIYDGRVGAALGYLVRLFLEENRISYIPDELHFYWGQAKEDPKIKNTPKAKLRNPFKGIYKFKQLTNNSDAHIRCNLKANWLLLKIINQHGFGKLTLETGALRAMEAALFMIGYDLKKSFNIPEDRNIKEIISKKLKENSESKVKIPLLNKKNNAINTFSAELVREEGILVDNLGVKPLILEWKVFEEVVSFLKQMGGKAVKGNAVNGKLGDNLLPFTSIEGHIAFKIYGKKEGDTVFRRITPIAGILIWAGICRNGKGFLELII